MKIKYLAHAAFLITSEKGVKIITDPYHTEPGFSYGEIKETADIVTASHGHGDHNNVAAVKGNPQHMTAGGEVKGVKIKAIASAHDDMNGNQRGQNTIFCFEVDGVNVCHLGDLGHELSSGQVKEIGKVDVVLVPVGGFYTIDAATAIKVCDQLKPKVIVPMHYKTEKSGLPISGVEDFLKGKSNVTHTEKSEVDFKARNLPAITQIMVLKPAL